MGFMETVQRVFMCCSYVVYLNVPCAYRVRVRVHVRVCACSRRVLEDVSRQLRDGMYSRQVYDLDSLSTVRSRSESDAASRASLALPSLTLRPPLSNDDEHR